MRTRGKVNTILRIVEASNCPNLTKFQFELLLETECWQGSGQHMK
jgi:hypothetical protein